MHELIVQTAVETPASQRHTIVDALVGLAAVTGGGDSDAVPQKGWEHLGQPKGSPPWRTDVTLIDTGP